MKKKAPINATPRFRRLIKTVLVCLLLTHVEVVLFGTEFNVRVRATCGLRPRAEPQIRASAAEASQPCFSNRECPAGTLVSYHSWSGADLQLHQFVGMYVSFLVAKETLRQVGAHYISEELDRYDLLYSHLKEFLRTEPLGDGPLIIAEVPETCGAGCGQLGRKGVELGAGIIWEVYQRDLLYEIVMHEMCHNFDLYSAAIFIGEDTAHAWTAFIQPFIKVYDREGYLDESRIGPDAWLQDTSDRFFAPYLQVKDHSWQQCVRDGDCGHLQIGRDVQGGLFLKLSQFYSREDISKVFRYLNQSLANGLWPSTVGEKNNLLVRSLSYGVEQDLTCLFDWLEWPVDSNLQSELQANLTPSPDCADQDGDGYSRFAGDLVDDNAAINPAAVEIANGKDDDLNGLVDEILIEEQGDFSNHFMTPFPLTIPSRVLGELDSEAGDNTDYFSFYLDKTTTVALRIRSLEGFSGAPLDLLLHRLETPSRLSSKGLEKGVENITWSLPAGEWRFRVYSGGESRYELIVGTAEGRLALPAPPSCPYRVGSQISFSSEPPPVLQNQPGLRQRFWVSGHGWIGTLESTEPGQDSLQWEIPEDSHSASLTFRTQFLSEGVPVTNASSPTPLGEPCRTNLILPFHQASANTFTGVALTNMSRQKVALQVSAFKEDGELAELPSNPLPVDLGPGNQLAWLGPEIFGTSSANLSWMSIESPGADLGSLFLFGDSKLTLLDGSVASRRPLPHMIFSRILEGDAAFKGRAAVTEIWLVNPTAHEVSAELRLFSSAVSTAGQADQSPLSISSYSRDVLVAARSLSKATVSELFPKAGPISSGHLQVLVSSGEGLVGFELIRFPGTVIGLNASSPSTSTTLYSAQLASAVNVFTNVKLINTGDKPSLVRLEARSEAGEVLGSPAEFSLQPQEWIEEDAGVLFEFPASGSSVGSLRIVSDSPEVFGDVVFGDPISLEYAAALPLQTEKFRRAVFSHVANVPGIMFTGLALSNPGTSVADVSIKSFYPGGTLVGMKELTLAPGGRISKLLAAPDMIPASSGQAGGYIEILSTQGLIGQELFGKYDLQLLSAVPPRVEEGCYPLELADPQLITALKREVELGDSTAGLNTCSASDLKAAFLSFSGISNLNGLGELSNLRRLDLEGNQVDDMTPLANLSLLWLLDLRQNRIPNLEAVSAMRDLEILWISRNSIQDIAPVSNLVKLKALDLGANDVSDLKPLQDLPNLDSLYLDDNPITEIRSLVQNPGLGAGDVISLWGTELDAGDCADLKALQDRGVELHHGVNCP